MGLPLEETTPVTEVIEATVDRVTEALHVLGPLAEQSISDLTRVASPDTSIATTVGNAATFWSALIDQAALGAERLASNITLLTHDQIPIVEWVSQTPIDIGDPPPATGCIYRPVDLLSSEQRPIDAREVRVARPDGTLITRFDPAFPDGRWTGQVFLRVRTFGWVPSGPIAGSLQPVAPFTMASVGPPSPVYCSVG